MMRAGSRVALARIFLFPGLYCMLTAYTVSQSQVESLQAQTRPYEGSFEGTFEGSFVAGHLTVVSLRFMM